MTFAGTTLLSIALTPTARSAAIDVTEEIYDITTALTAYAGYTPTTSDAVFATAPFVLNTHVGIVSARVSDATHIAIQWGNFTAAANVPPAGTYKFLIQRF